MEKHKWWACKKVGSGTEDVLRWDCLSSKKRLMPLSIPPNAKALWRSWLGKARLPPIFLPWDCARKRLREFNFPLSPHSVCRVGVFWAPSIQWTGNRNSAFEYKTIIDIKHRLILEMVRIQ